MFGLIRVYLPEIIWGGFELKKMAESSLFISTAIWGSTFLIINLLVGANYTIKPYNLLFLRFGIATVAAIAILRPTRWPQRRELIGGLIIGFAAWAGYTFQTLGLVHTTPARSGFITSLFVVFVPFVSLIWEKQPLTRNIMIALPPAIIGLWAISGASFDPSAINYGDRLTLLSATSYAFQVVGIQVFTQKGDWKILTIMQFAFIFIASFPFAVNEGLSFTYSFNTWGALFYLGLVASVGALGVQMYAQRFTTSSRASMIYISEPIFAALFAWIVGGHTMARIEIFGALLILIAMLLSRDKPSPAKGESTYSP